eukprot:scaffold22125_cov96-Isochrysis_galbana.AAC.1
MGCTRLGPLLYSYPPSPSPLLCGCIYSMFGSPPRTPAASASFLCLAHLLVPPFSMFGSPPRNPPLLCLAHLLAHLLVPPQPVLLLDHLHQLGVESSPVGQEEAGAGGELVEEKELLIRSGSGGRMRLHVMQSFASPPPLG